MKKSLMLLIAIFVLSLSLVISCGDDGDDNGGTDGDTSADGDDSADGDNNDAFGSCDGNTDPCLAIICASKAVYDSCIEAGANCDAIVACVDNLKDCYCPNGTVTSDMTKLQQCPATYSTCITSAATGMYDY